MVTGDRRSARGSAALVEDWVDATSLRPDTQNSVQRSVEAGAAIVGASPLLVRALRLATGSRA